MKKHLAPKITQPNVHCTVQVKNVQYNRTEDMLRFFAQIQNIFVTVYCSISNEKTFAHNLFLYVFKLNCHIPSGLGTEFFSVLNDPFFSVLLKNATFFSVNFLSFWTLMKTKRMMRSFAKNVKEHRESFVLLQRT